MRTSDNSLNNSPCTVGTTETDMAVFFSLSTCTDFKIKFQIKHFPKCGPTWAMSPFVRLHHNLNSEASSSLLTVI